jgi:hypothetical protein
MFASTKITNLDGSVRRANAADAVALTRLLADGGEVHVPAVPGNHVLVLDVASTVIAALHVTCDGKRAHVQFLVVDPAFATVARAIEERMIGVATALCEAYGCASLDICATPQNDEDATRHARAS